MAETKLDRFVHILELIENEPDTWTNGKLGVRFGVSKQSINRDIKKLRKSGFDILSSYKGYRLISNEKNRQLL